MYLCMCKYMYVFAMCLSSFPRRVPTDLSSQTVCNHIKDREREREGDWHKLISTLIPISDSTIYYKGLSEQTNEKKHTHDTQRKKQI